MPIGVTDDSAALAESISRWAARHAPIGDHDAARPVFWDALAAQGLLGLAVPEEHGGAGAAPEEIAVAAEQLGNALVAGPFLPTAIAATVLALDGGDAAETWLPRLADGSTTASIALEPLADGPVAAAAGAAPALVLGSGTDLVLAAQRSAAGQEVLVLYEPGSLIAHPVAGIDPSRALARVDVVHGGVAPPLALALAGGTLADVAVTLAAAEAAGLAGWCLSVAVEHAKVREQFGRPIGQFQAVKHACAEMLVHVEAAAAVAWDAARALGSPQERALAAAVAGATALDGAVTVAKACIQVLGGIGYTWEHDAHRYLRRAVALRQLLGGGSRWRRRAAELAVQGRRRTLALDLDDERAVRSRDEVRSFLTGLDGLDDAQRRRRMADEGYLQPHWPPPWGRGAGAVEQLVIDQEFRAAGVRRPDLVIGSWCLATIIAHGTEEQQERFVPPTLRGEITWCQLFSEPGAGSDLAALQTKAVRTDGGWLLTGQKVWTSLAHTSDWGLCLARTDTSVPKHQGITCFVVDMRAQGVDVRALRELTGRAMFNEVFLSDVFVPDDHVVGAVDDGWRAGRTTLSNERVAMSTGSTMGSGVEGLLRVFGGDEAAGDPVVRDRLGALVAEGQVLALLGHRTTLSRLSGHDPGPAASIRKLLGMRHAQDCAELQLELLGPEGATSEGQAAWVTEGFLATRALTIAGGTTEVQRNVVAERILGLPRDPEPQPAPTPATS